MLSLLLRNLLFTILQPGVVVGLVPYLILRYTDSEIVPGAWHVRHLGGAALAMLGVVIAGSCILRFATDGEGTLSPLDPTKKLVIRGLYLYSRNPMYVGVMLIMIGEIVFFWSLALAIYAAIVFVAFNLFIVLHEEPRCRREFGREYEDYCRKVRRWI